MPSQKELKLPSDKIKSIKTTVSKPYTPTETLAEAHPPGTSSTDINN